jgi:NADPH:quinone reductase-like Zn-dependent oxidoreductase
MARREQVLSSLNVSISQVWCVCASRFCVAFMLLAVLGGPNWHLIQPVGAATSSQRVALVTGANRGIGLALSTVLADKGWRVIATCRDPEHADELRAL